MSNGLNLYLPLVYNKQDGPYKTTKNLKEAIIQNLRVLFLTNPGERVMDRNFGIGIKQFLFENITAYVLEKIQESVFTQIARYMPYLQILDFEAQPEENTVYCKLIFSIDGIGEANIFDLMVEGNS